MFEVITKGDVESTVQGQFFHLDPNRRYRAYATHVFEGSTAFLVADHVSGDFMWLNMELFKSCVS